MLSCESLTFRKLKVARESLPLSVLFITPLTGSIRPACIKIPLLLIHRPPSCEVGAKRGVSRGRGRGGEGGGVGIVLPNLINRQLALLLV